MSAHDGHCPCAFSREKVGTTSAREETRRLNKGLMAITKLEIVLKWSKLRKLGSFRAENVSYFVKALLDCEKGDARQAYAGLVDRYPLAVTRDLRRAKEWIRDHARGTERYGLVASSKATGSSRMPSISGSMSIRCTGS